MNAFANARIAPREETVLIPLDPQPEKPILGCDYIWRYDEKMGRWAAHEVARCAGLWVCPVGVSGEVIKRFGHNQETILDVSIGKTENPDPQYFWVVKLKEKRG